jgi:hypothetical protein
MHTSSFPRPVTPQRMASLSLLVAGCCAALSVCADQPQIRWATSVIGFSSQYSSPGYGAVQTLGEPNVFPNYGDDTKAWSPRTENGQREHLVLGYNDPIPVAGVAIFETYYPGAVDKVLLRDAATGDWVEVWSGTAAAKPEEARVFLVSFAKTAFLVDAVRIELDSPNVPGWHEIDAVAIMDSDPTTVGPVIGNFTITSAGAETLFTELADELVTGRVLLTDFITGVATAELQLIDAAGNAVGPAVVAMPVNPFDPVHYNREWSGTVVIPQGTPTGEFGLRIRAVSVGGGESVVDQSGLFQVTDTLPRPDGLYQLTKVIASGDVAHSFDGKTYVVRDFGNSGSLSFSAPLINRPGEIAYRARLRDQNNVTASAAYLQSGATRKVLANSLVTGFSGAPSSLNDSGWVSFWGSTATVPVAIYKSNGDETLLIDDSPGVHLTEPAINNQGVVVYRRPVPDTNDWELWTGDGVTRRKIFSNTDVNADNTGYVGQLASSGATTVTMGNMALPRIDDRGRVYFTSELRVNSGQPSFRNITVIVRKTPGEPFLGYLLRKERDFTSFDLLFHGISPNGRILVGTVTEGSSNAAIPPGGWEWVDIQGGHHLIGYRGTRYVTVRGRRIAAFASINDSGRIAYITQKWETAGATLDLRSSADPTRVILASNQFLDGRRVKYFYLSSQAISQRGEIACLVEFTDGHQAIYRASPLTSGGAESPRLPDSETMVEPGGLLDYTFEDAARGAWLELPPRGEVTISSPTAGGRITQLLGISDHLASRAEVLVNGAVVGTLAPGDPLNLVAATGSGAAAVTLRGLTVTSAKPNPLAVQLFLNNPTLDLQIEGAGVPLLIQPPLRAHRADELMTLTSGAVDPVGFSFQWSREGAGPLVDDERTSGTASEELEVYPYEADDAGLYTLAGTGPGGTVAVNVRVVNALPFVNWATSFFPGQEEDAAITGPDATPLSDGIPNLVKYAFGIDPTQPMTPDDRQRIARVNRVIPGEQTRVELSLLLHPAAVDVGLALESSPDAAVETWTVLGAQELGVRENLTPAGRELNVLLPAAGGQAQFYRLRLVYSPPL